MSNLTPIKSFAEYKAFAESHGYCATTNLYLDRHRSPIGDSAYTLSGNYAKPEGLPEGDYDAFTYRSGNENNFWVLREALRFIEGPYLQCAPIARALCNKDDSVKYRHFYHMLHTSVEDTTMVAYTPNHQYGLADRQVKMKIGRYLQKFYADVFDQEQIRAIANNVQGGVVKWAYGSEAIRTVYENGPGSCMKTCGRHGDTHPVEAYGYQYPDDSYQFGLAYLEDASGSITARCLCDLKSMKYTRFYGDDGCILGSKLDDMGYSKTCSMDDLGCRLKYLGEYRNQEIIPYLDGDGKRVDLKHDSATGENYWLWCETGDYEADEPDGLVDEEEEEEDDSVYCECCDCSESPDESSYSDHHEISVCSSCAGDSFVYAYYRRGGSQTWVRDDECVEVNGDYYLDDSEVLEYHDIVCLEDGEYVHIDDVTTLYDGEHVHDNHPDLVRLHDDEWALTSDPDVVKLINGDYALDTDNSVVELENDNGYALDDDDDIVEIDGDYYLKTDDDIVEVDDTWYLKSDDAIFENEEGDWVLVCPVDEFTIPLPFAANEEREGVSA